jgi:hypothetical protein
MSTSILISVKTEVVVMFCESQKGSIMPQIFRTTALDQRDLVLLKRGKHNLMREDYQHKSDSYGEL